MYLSRTYHILLFSLERRFLDRVAQTTKVKTPGTSGSLSASNGISTTNGTHHVSSALSNTTTPTGSTAMGKSTFGDAVHDSIVRPSTPPWLRPPANYKPGNGAILASRTTGYTSTTENKNLPMSKYSLGLDTTQKIYHNSNVVQHQPSTGRNIKHGFAEQRNDSIGDELSQTILSQLLAQHNSNAQLNHHGSLPRDNSMVDAILQSAMSHEHINQLLRDGTLNSSPSLSDILRRQTSLDTLLALDLQSMNSTDNLASLIANNTGTSQFTKNGHKSSLGLGMDGTDFPSFSGNNSSLVNARRLASGGHLEHLMSSLSSSNGGNKMTSGLSAMNFPSFLQNNSHPSSIFNNSSNSLYGTGKRISFRHE